MDHRVASSSRPAVRTVTWLAGGLGLAIAIALALRSGLTEIIALLKLAGWGMLWLPVLRLLPLGLDALGWRELLPPARRTGVLYLSGVAVVRESVSNLIPFRIGGEIVGIRMLVKRGLDVLSATTSVVVEVTLWLASQIVFAVVGCMLLVATRGSSRVAVYGVIGVAIAVLAISAFYALQRRAGLFAILDRVLARVVSTDVIGIVGNAGALDAAIRSLYAESRRIRACLLWQLGGFFIGTLESWLAFRLIGAPVGVVPALIVESLSTAVTTATFFVPAAIGTQEAGLVLLVLALGIPGGSTTALALSAMRRLRQIILGVPSIAVWFGSEARV